MADFENNRFDQDLPDLYKRGFIKVYAKFLKLDPDKIAQSFSTANLGAPPQNTADSSLGRVEVEGYSSHYTSPDESSDAAEGPGGIDAAVYWKIAIALGVVVGFFGLLVISINLMNSDSGITDKPQLKSVQNRVAKSSIPWDT